MCATPRWMIYGANGYTGRLIAAEARARGMAPILAGRSRAAIEALAAELGAPVDDVRVFDLGDVDRVAAELADVALVLNCAGPFLDTNKPMLKACLQSRTHYLDITGEVAVFERVIKWRESFVEAGIVAIPGVGFDVVPSDCLARRLKERLRSAHRLILGIRLDASASPGTARTYVHALPAGGLVRQGGTIKLVPPAWRTRSIDFGEGPERAMTIAWGDVSTAYHSSGFTEIEAYFQVRPWVLWAFRLSRPIRFVLAPRALRDALGRVAARLYHGPDAAQRERNGARVWGRAEDREGRAVTMLLRCPDGYALTVDASLCAVTAVLAGEVAPGGYTPAIAFGAAFLDRLRGVSVEERAG
ncbi:MAG: saccharopine dehydrogenase NADP-binding domain-containing protein [Myxococcales bacterium]|nr:saccharopine dehydrogenase NADP-binding domain-containing protein [Myxococcales bacterium]